MAVTAQTIVDGALRALNVLPGGSSASGSDLTDALSALTALIRSWECYGLQGWARKIGTISLTSGVSSYTCGSGGTGLTDRPTRIHGAWIRDSNNEDSRVEILSRKAYYDLPNKEDDGDTTAIYYDPQFSLGVIYLYPVIEDSTHDLILDYAKPLAELDSGSDSLEMPPEWHRALKWNLAAELATEYGMKDVPQVVQAKADSTLGLLIGAKQNPEQPIVGWPDEAYDA